jgi:hypothetical protein
MENLSSAIQSRHEDIAHFWAPVPLIPLSHSTPHIYILFTYNTVDLQLQFVYKYKVLCIPIHNVRCYGHVTCSRKYYSSTHKIFITWCMHLSFPSARSPPAPPKLSTHLATTKLDNIAQTRPTHKMYRQCCWWPAYKYALGMSNIELPLL